MDAIEVIGLTKRFGDNVAVNGITFQAREGETFGFLGASLSGALFASAIGVATTAIGLAAFRTGPVHIVALLVGLALTCLCFSTMGTLVAAYRTENVGEVLSLLNLVRLPLLFISGVFIPIASMPTWGQGFALLYRRSRE